MHKILNDQAAGLRRMMAGRQPKIMTVFSALSTDSQPRLLTQLAAAVSAQNRDVLIVDATQDAPYAQRYYGNANSAALLQVACQKASLAQSIRSSKLGFSTVKLLPKQWTINDCSPQHLLAMEKILHGLSNLYEVVMIDGTLESTNMLANGSLENNDILIRIGRSQSAIKQGYALIKQIYQAVGKRPFGIIVEEASDAQAAEVFRNIYHVARKFLQLELEFYGAIPEDKHLEKAVQLGRSVIDAFPKAEVAKAITMLAKRINYQQSYAGQTEIASFA
jgi:flagellar biosynthesis protein FlhG